MRGPLNLFALSSCQRPKDRTRHVSGPAVLPPVCTENSNSDVLVV